MNYDYDDSEYVDSSDAETWSDSIFDYADSDWEAKRRGRQPTRPVKTASGANPFRPRQPSGAGTSPVTQAQLEAALARVRKEITANASGIKALDGRVRTAVSDQQRFATETRRHVDKLRGDLKTTQTLSALIPLIAPPGSDFADVAPLIHLVGPDLLGGASSSTTPGQSGGLLGNTNNLIAIGALLYATRKP